MAKRRKSKRSSNGGRSFMGLGTKGIVSLGLIGAGAGALFGEQIGSMIPVVNQQSNLVKGAVGGFAVGGPLGAVLNVAKQYMAGNQGSMTAVPGAW